MTLGTVVVGAGQSGLNVAIRLRALGYDKPITLIGEEAHLPYQRPPLSKKFLAGELDAKSLLLRPADFYQDQRIDLKIGMRGTAIDTRERRIDLSDGSALAYEDLVLATGTRARELPLALTAGLRGVHVLRGADHALALQRALAAGRNLVVVGGGFVGLEVAATVRQAGMNVTVLEQAPRILQRVAGAEVSQRLRALHQAHGVRILEQHQLASLRGQGGQVHEVVLADGQVLPADVVLVGIGELPNVELAQAGGLAVQDGIVVDQHGQTTVPGVYACGDCARFPWGEASIRLESVHNAMAQGDCVAQAIVGRAVPYAPVPWFWSDQYDCKLQMVGLSTGHDAVVVRDAGPRPTQGASVWYFKASHLLAVEALHDAAAFAHGRRWLEQKKSPRPEDLASPTLPLKDLSLH